MRKIHFFLIALAVIASMLASACGGAPAPTAEPPAPEPAVTEPPAAEAPATEAPAPSTGGGDRVQVRWFVGLGTGSEAENIPLQEALVDQFNASQDHIQLVAEFVAYESAPDVLSTQIAAGNPPDIIGPVGWSGVNQFDGLFLDLEPYLDKLNYDFSDFDQSMVETYRIAGQGLLGIPFAVYPSAIFYNRDLFDEADLAYPPASYGEPYADGDPWTVAKLEELAMKLTVDKNGNDAASPDFDPENIVQFGYDLVWSDQMRTAAASLFGACSLVDEGGNAVLCDQWREGIRWYYQAMHTRHFKPNATYRDSDLLAAGNSFDSGNLAMNHSHLWYTCCLTSVPNWDVAAIPAYNDRGDVTVKLHADTFRILKSSQHSDEAVEVLTWMVGDGAADLLGIYGGFPARKSLQEDFIAGLNEEFPQGVHWEVFVEGMAYPDVPNHESNLPNYAKAFDRLNAFDTLYQAEPDLDIDAELDKLISDLQAIFDEVQ